MINLKSRKVKAGSKAAALVILIVAVAQFGLTLTDEQLLTIAGAIVWLTGKVIEGIATEDAAKISAGVAPGPPSVPASDPVNDSPPPRNP